MLGPNDRSSKELMFLALLFVSLVFVSAGSASEYPQFQGDSNNTGFTNDIGIPNTVDSVTEYNVLSDAIYSSPVVSDKQVYFGTNFGKLVAVWRENGSFAWEESGGGTIEGAPVYTEDKVFAASVGGDGDKGIFSVWRDNGSFIEGLQQDDLGGDVETPLVKKGNYIYTSLTGTGTEVVSLNMEGLTDEWRYDAGVGIDAAPAVTEDRVVVYDENEVMHVLNRTDGSLLWSDPAGDGDQNRGNAPTIHGGKVYLISDNGEVFAYDLESGTRDWGPLSLGSGVIASPAYDNGSLYVGDVGGNFYRINASEGTIERTETLPNSIYSSPTVTRDRIYLGALDGANRKGFMYGLYKNNFSIVWSREAGREIAYSGSAVSDSQVFFTAWDSKLYILEGPTPDTEPPQISDKQLIDRTDFNGVVKDSDKVSVYANITDESDIASVNADLSDFGASSSVSMSTESATGFDWNSDGELSGSIYGVNASVSEGSSNDGAGKSTTITAEDSIGNIVSTNSFGDLILDTVAPVYDRLNVSYVSTLNPVFKVNFTEETSGISADSIVDVSDSSGNVFNNVISTVDGVNVNGLDTINFDFDQRAGSLDEGTVQVDVDAEDVAGNQESLSETFEVDNTPPSELSIVEPSSQVYLNSEKNMSLRYNYTEENPFFTVLRFFDQEGAEDAVRNFSESSVNPDQTKEIFLENTSHSFKSNSTYDVYLYAEDLAGNSKSITRNTLLTIDNYAPVLNDSEKTGQKSFEFKASDNEALNVSTIEASDFEFKTEGISGNFVVDACSDLVRNCTVSVNLDALADTYQIKVGLSQNGNFSDAANNTQEDENITVVGMDEVPPSIKAYNLEEIASSDGVVTGGDSVKVYANVSDGVKVSTAESNMTEFGKGAVELSTEVSAGKDWNNDGEQKNNVYGAEITVSDSAPDNLDASSWINATDNSSNTNTTPEFGSLEIDNTPPQVNIYTPIAKDGIINSSEASNFKINGTIDNDNSGQITVNVSDASSNNSKQVSFSGGTFEVFMDASMLSDGSLTVEALAEDNVGQKSDLVSGTIIKDTQAPSLDQGFHINTTAFNVSFSDSISGLDSASFEASDFNTDYGSFESVFTRFSSGDTEGNLTTEITPVDSETVNFSINGEVRDEAGNILNSGWVELSGMDSVPPSFDYLNLSDVDGDGIVASGNKIQVYANLSDGTGIESAQANLTEFDAGRVSLSNETSINYDWNNDGSLDSNVYGANATVGENVVSGTGSATVNATDNSSNLNENTSEEFGSLEIDSKPPEVNIFTPIADDGIINSSEASNFKVNGTIDNDNTGEIVVNVSDSSSNTSKETSFSAGTFEIFMDASMLNEGSINVEAVATDDTGQEGSLTSEPILKDTQSPLLGEGFRVNTTAFNVSFSDAVTGLEEKTFTASEFDINPGTFESVYERFSDGDAEGNLTVEIGPVDSETVNFSISGEVSDLAGNKLTSGWVELTEMDSMPPSFEYLNLSDIDGDGIVAKGNKIRVYANISDGTGIESAQANLTEFDAGRVSLENETSANYDWNDDGSLDNNVYGANATVGENVESGTGSATVNATDNSSNLNENTSEEFGSLDIVTEDPSINISSPLQSDPVYLKETDDLDVFFNYTEPTPDELNVSIGTENTIFNSLSGGTDVEASRTVSYTDLPGNGTYDLKLNLTNTAGLYGTDSEASSVIIDSYAPGDLSVDVPTVKRYLQSSNDLSVDYSYTEANPDWTDIRLINSSDEEGLSINVSESSSNPDSTVDFTGLENLAEGVNYSIEVEASDKVGRTALVTESNLLVVDDTAPVLRDPRKVSDGVYRFDIFDNASGISLSGLSTDDLEMKEDISASFNIINCNEGDFNCTVEVDILEDTNNEQLTAQITDSTGTIYDVAGNTRYDDQVILQDTDTLKPALESYSLNVTQPVNNSYAPDTINVTLVFNESMDTSVDPSVYINNLDSPYAPSGSYSNSTRWSGVFDILDQDEQSQAYINISNAEDEAGNALMSSEDSAVFDVDTEEPLINVINNFNDQNLTGSVDLTSYFEETTSNGFLDTYEYRSDSGNWQEITSPSSWNSEEASDGSTDFRINASDSTGNTASLTEVSNVDNTPPFFNQSSITIVDDSGTEGILNMDDNFSVEVNASDLNSDVSEVYANVSRVTDLSGFISLDETPSGNFSKTFTANESAQITEYSPEIKAVDTPGNENVSTTENSIEVDSRPFELTPDSIYTLVGTDEYSNDIVNPGDEINVSWNSSETGISDIQTVEVDFGEYGGIVEASDQGDGVYSAVTTVSSGEKNGERYFGNIEVTTSSGTDNESDDMGVPVNNEDPSAPTDLDASRASGGDIDLSWTSSSSLDADAYSVYRNGSYVAEASTTFYRDEGLPSGEVYNYKIATVDNASNEGLNSSEVSVEADGEAPFIESAVTYNKTAINVTIKDELNNVSVSDTNILDLSPGSSPYYTGFGDDAPVVQGLFLSSTEYGTGAEPDITVNLEDNIGNSRGFAYTVTAEDGVSPEVETLSMDNVTADKEAQLKITYTESMNQSIDPDIIIDGPTPDTENGRWTDSDTYTVDYTFNYEGKASGSVTVGNASDDSGNVQENDVSTGFEIDTVVPDPSILDIVENENISGDISLNMSVIDGEDVDDVEWRYETDSNNSIAVLDSPSNSTVWNTPSIEEEVKLWLEVSDPVGNTGTDSVNITVDNIAPNLIGDLSSYTSRTTDLTSQIYSDGEASVTYQYRDSGVWTMISTPASWNSEEASEGSTLFRVNATDDAGNFRSSDYSTVIDNTEPGSFNFDNSSDKILSAGDNFDVNYSYVEDNPANTTVEVIDSEGNVVDQKFITESGSNPSDNLTFDTSGFASDNYSVELTAKDLAGLENSTEAFSVFVDDEKPELGNGTYYNDTRMSFQVIDGVSGIDVSTVDSNSFEVVTDAVEASSFNVIGCEDSDLKCTVNVTLKDESSLAEIGVKNTVTDRAGNEVDNTVYIIDPDVDGPQANLSLNLSEPYNLNDATREVTLALEFDRKIDTGPREEVELIGASKDYNLRGTYYNSTYWNGTFTLVNDSQEDDITVNASNIKDLDGNKLLQNEVGSFKVDFRPPEIDLSGVDENVSGGLNLSSMIQNKSSGIDKFNVTYGDEETRISNPDNWDTAELEDGKVNLSVEASDEAGNNASQSTSITVDNEEPVVSNISLNVTSDEVIDLGEVINITVNASDNGTGIQSVSANVSNISENGTINLQKRLGGNYSNTVEVEKEVELENYSIDIETTDFAGNRIQNSTDNISVNSTQIDDQEPDQDQDQEDDDGSSSDGGGSSGGGGGGGFLPPEDDQEEDDGQQDEEQDNNDSTLGPSEPLSININPQRAFLEANVGETVVFSPEISVSEGSSVEIDLQGFNSEFNRNIRIQEARQIDVDLGSFESEDVYTGTLIASVGNVSSTASISVDVSKKTKEVDMDTRLDDGQVKYNSSLDADGEVEVSTKVYRADSDEIVYSSSNATIIDNRSFNSEISLDKLSPGLYTIETRIEDDDNVFIATDQFRVDEAANVLPLLAGVLALAGILSFAYLRYMGSEPAAEAMSRTKGRQFNTNRSHQETGSSTESSNQKPAEEIQSERDPFGKVDDKFGDDEVVRDIQEASERFSRGELAEADSKLKEAKESGFFDSENIEDVKNKMKEVHRKFEDHL